MTIPDCAESLRLIGQGGSNAFYRGPIADKLVAEMDESRLPTNPYKRGAETVAALFDETARLLRFTAILASPPRVVTYGLLYIGTTALGAP